MPGEVAPPFFVAPSFFVFGVFAYRGSAALLTFSVIIQAPANLA